MMTNARITRAIRGLLLAALAAGAATATAAAQDFDCGSTGADGALTLAAGDVTLDLPPDGVFHFTTVTIPFNRTLRFRRNPLNTPVTILATGDVLIEGVISLDGGSTSGPVGAPGGPGGYDGGDAALGEFPAGDGQGPGGGISGVDLGRARHDYGSPLLIPMVGGSGGAGSHVGGGGGGGAILIASNTRILLRNSLSASGGAGCCQGGGNIGGASGGEVRLLAPVVSGPGHIAVGGGGGAAAGRARIDTIDLREARSVGVSGAPRVIGSAMAVRPQTIPTLSIVEVAGTPIAEGAAAPVHVTLPFGSPTTQSVTVRARDFTGVVPIEIVAVPLQGSRMVQQVSLDMAGQPVAETTVQFTFPENIATRIDAWVR